MHVHWFRKGLRLHDNPALLAGQAASPAGSPLLPLFVLDPHFTRPAAVGANCFGFMFECLADLDAALARTHKSHLVVARGPAAEVLPRVLQALGAAVLSFESDTEPFAKERDSAVVAACQRMGITVKTAASHTLWDPEYLADASNETLPASMTSFTNLVRLLNPVPSPVDPPAAGTLPPLPDLAPLREAGVTLFEIGKPPTLRDLVQDGYDPAAHTTPFRGGETVALEMMARYLDDTKRVREFEKPRTRPNAIEPDTTVLSPHLKFGSLSVRRMYHAVAAVYRTGKHTMPPVSLHGQLLWREYFYLAMHLTPNFVRMAGNPLCRQIPWRDPADPEHTRLLAAWEAGQTGYPFIDAGMAQLRTEGWIHHLMRHAVACFLTRGDLWISWEHGRDVFDRLLLDADVALNAANWMWLSASAFFHQYHRVYSPVSFGSKTDKDGAYIRKHLPVLARMPAKYIYEPWKAPAAVQRAAGCVVGVDYPAPIVDHDAARRQNLDRMALAFQAHKRAAAAAAAAAPAKRPRQR